MRTTVTLDSDVDALLRRSMEARGVSFKVALNDAVRTGLTTGQTTEPYRLRPVPMGRSSVPVTKALQLAAEIEDDEIVRKLLQRR